MHITFSLHGNKYCSCSACSKRKKVIKDIMCADDCWPANGGRALRRNSIVLNVISGGTMDDQLLTQMSEALEEFERAIRCVMNDYANNTEGFDDTDMTKTIEAVKKSTRIVWGASA